MINKTTETHAGEITPSDTRYAVTFTHGSTTLQSGDIVIMRYAPGGFVLLRLSDTSIHNIFGGGYDSDQYVHLVPLD